MKLKLTEEAVRKLETGRDYFAWDTDLPRFGVHVQGVKTKSYVVQYRKAGKIRRYSIGRVGEALSVKDARTAAKKILAKVDTEEADPAKAKREKREAPTVAEVAERYFAEWAVPEKKPRSVVEDRRYFEKFILPAIGDRKVSQVEDTDIQKLHDSMKKTPYQANRMLALLHLFFNLCEGRKIEIKGKKKRNLGWKYRKPGTNPCREIAKNEEGSCERFLSGEELARLGAALEEAERAALYPVEAMKKIQTIRLLAIMGWQYFPVEELARLVSLLERTARAATYPLEAIQAIRLLILTGCRMNEILSLRWEYVNFEKARLELPESKTGKKVVFLNVPALELLAAIERKSEWVFPSPVDTRKHFFNLRRVWAGYTEMRDTRKGKKVVGHKPGIRDLAGIPDVRIHDLRHSFASVAVSVGLNLPVIGGLLGHSQASTTERYAHVADDPMRAAAEAVGKAMDKAMKGEGLKKVVNLEDHRK